MKRLMVLFLLISFFLPFSAEGSTATLRIQDRNFSDTSKDTGTIAFRVTIKEYEGNLWEFGFDVIYDSDILEYVKYTGGHLGQDTRYSFFDVTRINDNTLRVSANGYHITTFDYTSSDSIVVLYFSVKKYEETTLHLANLQGDFRKYETKDGFLLMRNYSSQSQPLGSGYPGLPYSQGYPFPNPLVPINNPYLYLYPSTPAPAASYYASPGVFPYQSIPYSFGNPYNPLWLY